MEQYLKTNIVPRVQCRTRGTGLENLHCSTRPVSDAWNSTGKPALLHASSFRRVEQYLKTSIAPRVIVFAKFLQNGDFVLGCWNVSWSHADNIDAFAENVTLPLPITYSLRRCCLQRYVDITILPAQRNAAAWRDAIVTNQTRHFRIEIAGSPSFYWQEAFQHYDGPFKTEHFFDDRPTSGFWCLPHPHVEITASKRIFDRTFNFSSLYFGALQCYDVSRLFDRYARLNEEQEERRKIDIWARN